MSIRWPSTETGASLSGQGRPCGVADPRPLTPPPDEVVLRRRPIGAQVAARQLRQRSFGIRLAPGAEPLLWPHQRDVLAAARAEAQKTPAGDWLEEAAPAGLQRQLNSLRPTLPHPGDQLVTGQRLAVEDLADRVDDRVELGLRDLHPLEPGVRVSDPEGAHRGRVDRQVGGWNEMERGAHEPGLDEGLVLPK